MRQYFFSWRSCFSRLLFLFLFALLIFSSSAKAETVTFGSVHASTTATYLNMGNEDIRSWNSFYAFLDQFPNLEKVDMFATPVKKDRIAELVERYPNVEFGWTISLADHFIRTDQTAFSTLHASNTPWMHSEIEFGVLKYCKNLMALDIGHNILKDVSFLYDCPKLKVLIIALNQIEDITPVGSLKDLEYLEVFMNSVKDISPLANLPHLMDLNMGMNYIEDLTPLYGMKQLKRLWMHHYNKNGRQYCIGSEEELRAALPNCTIDNISQDSTDGGWRKPHPHYDVIYRMFHTGVYEPFEDSYTDSYTDSATDSYTDSGLDEEPEATAAPTAKPSMTIRILPNGK